MSRTPHGSIGICSTGGRLRLQFPRSWYGGEQKYLTLGLQDTRDNRVYATNLVRHIEWDYLDGKFDDSLNKYLKTQPKTSLGLNLSQLWTEYCQYKSSCLKPATIHYLTKGLGMHIIKCPFQDLSHGIEIRDWLITHTTPNMSRRIVAALATAVEWGLKHGKCTASINCFADMSVDIRVEKITPQPNAFTHDERDRVIKGFADSKYYSFYAPLVNFWFMTGCRPSEAIGLTWGQITDDCLKIRFDRSVIHIGGKSIENYKSKTNRIRTFPSNEVLRQFLSDYRNRQAENTPLVFPSPTGKPIDYNNFSVRAWNKVVDPLFTRATTPYSCRDTFITDQIAKGIPIAVVALWCDNSVKTIERHYLDASALTSLKPL